MKIPLTENFEIDCDRMGFGEIHIYKWSFDLKELSVALLKADELGWKSNGISYNTGYYGDIEEIYIDIRLKD